jgi:hypothetical protein
MLRLVETSSRDPWPTDEKQYPNSGSTTLAAVFCLCGQWLGVSLWMHRPDARDVRDSHSRNTIGVEASLTSSEATPHDILVRRLTGF